MSEESKKPKTKPSCILVLIDAAPDITALVRQAHNEAKALDLPIVAIGTRPFDNDYSKQNAERYKRNMELMKNLGAHVFETGFEKGVSPLAEINEEYRIEKVYRGNWRLERFHKRSNPLVRAIKSIPSIKTEVVETDFDEQKEASYATYGVKTTPQGYAITVGLIALITGISESIKHIVDPNAFFTVSYNISIVYLIAVTFVAIRYGALPAIFASILSFVGYDYFFTAPEYRIGGDKVEELINLFLFLFSALGASALGNILRERKKHLELSKQRTEAMFYFNRNVASAESYEQALETIGRSLGDMLATQILIALPKEDDPQEIEMVYPKDFCVKTHEETLQAMKKAWEEEIATGRYTQHFPDADCYWVPMVTALKKIGLIGYCGEEKVLLADRMHFKSSLASQAGMVLERTQMLEISREALIAEEREKLRSALLSSVSHDLKTPLASIIGSLSAIKQLGKSLSKEDITELNSNALDEAERLHSFINNILSMSKMESGHIKLNKKWIGAADLVKETMKNLSRVEETHTIAIESSLKKYALNVDARLLQQVLQNLIDNAAKYSPVKSTITIGCEMKGKTKLAICVRDEGHGIPEEDLPRIFDKFSRLEKKDTKVAGTGLGLSIVKTLTEAHGARVKVLDNESLEKGTKGTTFMLIFNKSDFKPTEDTI